MPSLAGLYTLPEWVKLHTRKFGANPVTALQPTTSGGSGSATAAEHRLLQHEDQALGLYTRVEEDAHSHKLVANVFSSNFEHLNKAAVSAAVSAFWGATC